MKHKLKIGQEYLDNLLSGKKKSEVRLNDRDYQVGDLLEFSYYSEKSLGLTFVYFRITHIHSGLGLKENYVMLSVEQEQK